MAVEASRSNLGARAPRLVHRLEAWGTGLLFAAFAVLPLDCASTIGGALGRLIGPLLGISKRAHDNIKRALPGCPRARSRTSFAACGKMSAASQPNTPTSGTSVSSNRGDGSRPTASSIWTGRSRPARRMIIFSGHLANWEIGMLAAVQYGISVAQIYPAANNPLVDRMIIRFRGDAGQLIPKGAVAARRAIATLRCGAHLTMLADQKMNDGIPVPFFGRPAMTAPALAALALRYDCDVLPARVERLGGAHFRFTVFPPLPLPRTGDTHADAAALMGEVNAVLERWVRDRPEQSFWVHRRWPD